MINKWLIKKLLLNLVGGSLCVNFYYKSKIYLLHIFSKKLHKIIV